MGAYNQQQFNEAIASVGFSNGHSIKFGMKVSKWMQGRIYFNTGTMAIAA